ncbi:MAG: hypothetical protein ACXWEI_03010 [Mycobacterium sp.]
MTDTPADVVESIDPPRRSRNLRRMAVVVAIVLLLFGVPWWTLLASGAAWPTAVFVAGTLLFLAAAVALPSLMCSATATDISTGPPRPGTHITLSDWINRWCRD